MPTFFHPWLLSLALLAGAWLLAACSARLLHALAAWLPGWLVAGVSQAVALFPLPALAWAFIGWWVGALGLPVLSLMPETEAPALAASQLLARQLWHWVPPLFFLALPWTGHQLTCLVQGRTAWYRQSAAAVLPAVVWLAVVEDVFHLPGALAGVIPALHGQGGSSVLLALAPLALLAVLFCLGIAAGPRHDAPFVLSAEAKIREGAIALGHSPEAADRLHLRPARLRRQVVCVLSLAAWAVSLWACLGCPGMPGRGAALAQAFELALQQPLAPLLAAWPYGVCALSLWVVGRMIQPRTE